MQPRLAELFDAADVQKVMRENFYADAPSASSSRKRSVARSVDPNKSYEIVCISLYKEDLAQLDEQVRALKQAGLHRVNRSAVMRAALRQLSPSKLRKLLATQL